MSCFALTGIFKQLPLHFGKCVWPVTVLCLRAVVTGLLAVSAQLLVAKCSILEGNIRIMVTKKESWSD